MRSHRKPAASNLLPAETNPWVMTSYLQEDVALNRVVGPLQKGSVTGIHQSIWCDPEGSLSWNCVHLVMCLYGRGIESVQGYRNKSLSKEFFLKCKVLFGNMLVEIVLRHTDNLSIALQHQGKSTAGGRKMAQMTAKTLRIVECFDLFWTKVTSAADCMEVGEPRLPHQHTINGKFA